MVETSHTAGGWPYTCEPLRGLGEKTAAAGDITADFRRRSFVPTAPKLGPPTDRAKRIENRS